MIEFSQFKTDSSHYQQMLKLRHEILRKPLGLDLFAQDLSAEGDYLHFGIFENNQIIACLIIVPDQQQAVLKQMAVAPEFQGQRLGQKLVEYVETQLIKLSIYQIKLAARVSALGFYQRLGYQPSGQPFDQVSISHQWMIKNLLEK